MADYPFTMDQMLFRLFPYLGITLALFAVFHLWRRSGETPGARRDVLFEALNIGGVGAIFIGLWFVCGLSSLRIEQIKPAIAPILSSGFLLVLLSYLVYFSRSQQAGSASTPGLPPSRESSEGGPGSDSKARTPGGPGE